MDMTLPQFVEAVEAYLAGSKMTPTRLGKEAVGDPSFVFGLRTGRQPRRESIKKVMDYIAAAKVAAQQEARGSVLGGSAVDGPGGAA